MSSKMKWGLFVVIINLFVHCSAGDAEILQFNIKRDPSPNGGGDLKCYGSPLYIELDKTYKIRVDFQSVNTVYKEARWALYNTSQQNMLSIMMHTGKGYVESLQKFTATEIGSFNCTGIFFTHVCNPKQELHHTCVYKVGATNYHDHGVVCTTTINVHRAGERIIMPEASLTVNTQNFSTSGSEQDYYYHDGQGTMFTCTKIVGNYVQLSYTTLAGRFVSTNWQPSSSVTMYVKLTSSLNETTLKCLVSGDNEIQLNITLNLKLNTQGLSAFRVNGLIPPLKSQSDGERVYYFEYIFHNDENLTVEFIIDNTRYVPSNCMAEGLNIPYKLKEFFLQGQQAMARPMDRSPSFPLSQGGNGTFISCIVKKILPIYPNEELYNYTIKFIFHNPAYEPYFFGLSMSNVVQKFRNNTANQIEYEMDSIGANSLLGVCCENKSVPVILYDQQSSLNVGECHVIPNEDTCHLVRVVRKKHTNISPPNTQGHAANRSPYITGQENVQNSTITGLDTGAPGEKSHRNSDYQHNPNHEPLDEENPQAFDPRKLTTIEKVNTNLIPQLPGVGNHGIPTTFRSSSGKNKPFTFSPKTLSTDLINQEKADTYFSGQTGRNLGKVKGGPPSPEPNQSPQASGNGYSNNRPQLSQINKNISNKPLSKKTNGRSSTQKTTTSEIEVPSATLPDKEVDSNNAGEGKLNSAPTNGGTPWVLMSSVVVVILLVAAALWLAYSYTKKRRMIKQNPNVDYQNLPHHLEGPMATPSQWDNRADDVTYSHPVIENFYTVPTPNGKRANIEPVYSQPTDSNITYANTGVRAMVLNNEASYAKFGQTGPTYAEAGPIGPTYASVQKASTLTKRPQDTYAEIQKKHERNATNQSKGSHYQNLDASKPDGSTRVLPQINYANVQDLKPEYCGYVNGGVKDDIEPAYSELSNKT